MRGVSVAPKHFYPNGSIKELQSWGVNLIRLHIIESQWSTVEEGLTASRRIIQEADGSGIKFMLNLRLECQCDYARHLKLWQEIVPEFNLHKDVLGFDIVNEPWDDDKSMRGWKGALPVFHQAMRQMTDKVIMVQSGYWGSDSGFEVLAPFGDENTWYGCNIYSDQRFTHQGVGRYKTGVACSPGQGVEAALKEKERLITFATKFPDAKIFIPEIGVSKYADEESAEIWIDEVVGFIEGMGWSWCWHHYPGRLFPPRPSLDKYYARNRENFGGSPLFQDSQTMLHTP